MALILAAYLRYTRLRDPDQMRVFLLYNSNTCSLMPQSKLMLSELQRSARAFAIIGGISGGLSCLWFWFTGVIQHASASTNKLRWQASAVTSLFACTSVGLSFLLLDSNLCDDSGCKLASEGNVVLAGCVLFGVTGLVAFLVCPPKRLPPLRPPEHHAVTTTVLPDGTVTYDNVVTTL